MKHTRLLWLALAAPALLAAWPGVGDSATNFLVQDTTGGFHTLYAERGHTVLINFWRYDVPPCTTYLPRLQSMYDDYAGRGFRILAIHVSGEMEVVRRFARRYTYSFYYDAGDAYQWYRHGDSLPLCYVLDTALIVRYSSGLFDEVLLRDSIESVLPSALAESPGGVAPQPSYAGPTIVRNVLRLPYSLSPSLPASLLDASGRKVLDLKRGVNDVSCLAPGVYFVTQKGSKVPGFEGSSAKVIVQR